jgi:ElaB/YqjD/DUF883 family membrane-anchored ribosome-binding protein
MNTVKSNVKSFADQADGVRRQAADSLASAADSVRAAGSQSADAISDLANEAGKKLDTTATYVRAFPGDILGGLRNTVRRNPVGSLALATAFGLVAGFSYRSSSR